MRRYLQISILGGSIALLVLFIPRANVWAAEGDSAVSSLAYQQASARVLVTSKKSAAEDEKADEEESWDDEEKADEEEWEDDEEMNEEDEAEDEEDGTEDDDSDEDEWLDEEEGEEEKAKDKMKGDDEGSKNKGKDEGSEKSDDEGKGSETLTQEVVEERIVTFLEHIAELRVQLATIGTSETAEVTKIIDVIETKLLTLKEEVANMELGDTEALTAADKAISIIKSKFKKAESQLEEVVGDEEISDELSAENFDEMVGKVTNQLTDLGASLEESKAKLVKKEGKGMNPVDLQAMIDEIQTSFANVATALVAAKTAQESGDMATASKSIYTAFSELKIARSMLDKLNFGQMKEKDPRSDEEGEEDELVKYDELMWKAKYFLEKIGELHDEAATLDNRSQITERLTMAENAVMEIYQKLLIVGPDGDQEQLDALDDTLEAIKRHFKKAAQFIKSGQEQSEDDVLEGEEAEQAANELLERLTKRYNKFVKKYNAKVDEMSDTEKDTMDDLKEAMETNLSTAEAYFDQDNFSDAQKYGYAALVGAKTGIGLVKNIK